MVCIVQNYAMKKSDLPKKSHIYFSHMMEHLFDYVVAAEDKKNPPMVAPSMPPSVNPELQTRSFWGSGGGPGMGFFVVVLRL